jgi:uncharacterized membrane protein
MIMARPRLASPIPAALVVLTATLALARCSDLSQSTDTPADRLTTAAATAGPTVSSTKPTGATQDTTLDVSVYGSGFDRGSKVSFALAGIPSSEIIINSTHFVSPRQLRTNITILAAADTGAYDVIVTTSGGRKGIGTELFEVSLKNLATLITLPSLDGRTGEALAVNDAGTVIAGYSWELKGTMRAVKWIRQANGSWAISVLPYAATATGAIARGVNHNGDVAGNDFPGSTPHIVLWPATGGFSVLGCSDLGEAYGISAGGRVVVGIEKSVQPFRAAVWRPGSCRVNLPQLIAGGFARADAVNGGGTIVGGSALSSTGVSTPVRWKWVTGVWQIAQLDQRSGSVRGANATGDLAGSVRIACAQAGGCLRTVIWYAAGGSRQLGTLGGADSWARGINASSEVVGISTTAHGVNTAFFWSASLGMVQLPARGGWAGANAISDLRPDGTRLVVGLDSQGPPIAWVVRDP